MPFDPYFLTSPSLPLPSSLRHQYVSQNKDSDNDWFRLESNKDGTRWFGKCWYIHNLLKYEFNVEFDVSGVRRSHVITRVVMGLAATTHDP